MAAGAQTDRLAELEARIAAHRAARAPKPHAGAEKFRSASLAWRMVTELVVGVLMGAGIGWGLDSLVGSKPGFLILFTLLGLAAGVRTMIRSANEVARKEGSAAGREERG